MLRNSTRKANYLRFNTIFYFFSRRISLPDDVPCDICQGDKAPSVKSCLVCQVSYCQHHLKPHLRDPMLQRHRLTDPASFVSNSTLCRKHKKPLTMFCKKDQKPVCEKCTEGTHKNHKIVPLGEECKKVKVREGLFYSSVPLNSVKNVIFSCVS